LKDPDVTVSSDAGPCLIEYGDAAVTPPRILIVDDEESDRLLVQSILARAGYETFVASGGEEALRAYLEAGVDAVITDLHMPDVHGFELISILRDFVPRPALIALSGTGAIQLYMAEVLGARWTIKKPVDPALLLDVVERALAERSNEQGRRSG
jgi:DNA-binding NtrC family response regulator